MSRPALVRSSNHLARVMAQRKRAGPITQRSLDRNQLMRVDLHLFVRDSIVASIPACHPRQFAGDPGSIPGRGVFIHARGAHGPFLPLRVRLPARVEFGHTR